jgi:WD40 repeat protein
MVFYIQLTLQLSISNGMDAVFALVTSSGSLIAYNVYLPRRALVKMTAHAGDATTLAWHLKKRGIVATGGAGDRCVKVWDLEAKLALVEDDSYLAVNQNTMTSTATDSSISTENDSR